MGRRVEKGARYDSEARKSGVKAALASPLVIAGIILTGSSLFSLICRVFGISLQDISAQIVGEYRDRAYPIISWLPNRAGIQVNDLAKEILSLYLLVGGMLRRPLGAIFEHAAPTDGGAAVLFPFGRLGTQLDAFFNWAQERVRNRATWWRRPLFSVVAVVATPLTVWVFSSSTRIQ